MISTEKHRNLFTFKDCFRKHVFFSDKGEDNVHLNNLGVVRLAKYLKYNYRPEPPTPPPPPLKYTRYNIIIGLNPPPPPPPLSILGIMRTVLYNT